MSYGQTLNHIGLCLTELVFTHGQLYVTGSLVTDGANLEMIVQDTDEARQESKIANWGTFLLPRWELVEIYGNGGHRWIHCIE